MTVQAITFIFKSKKEVKKKKEQKIMPFLKVQFNNFHLYLNWPEFIHIATFGCKAVNKYRHLLGILLLLNKIQVF